MKIETGFIYVVRFGKKFPEAHFFEPCKDFSDAHQRIVQLECDYPSDYVGAFYTHAVRFPGLVLKHSEAKALAGRIFGVGAQDIEFCGPWFFPADSMMEIYSY